MRISQFPLNTAKETPADAEIVSHQLMIRAGLIRKLASGLYIWLPLGLRVLHKVEQIVRQEMQQAGALEVLMPALQPAELWQETGRWEKYGAELTRLKDRHNRDFCLGPTHEEVITDLARYELKSYKQLPVTYYQVQTKFRDEIRPRFGIMRSREFIMKDAYSFHLNVDSLQETYAVMHQAYTNILTKLGLNFRAVMADSGSIGGAVSHEFHVLADAGEDAIAISTASQYAANVEQAKAMMPVDKPPAPATEHLTLVDTPKQYSIKEISAFLEIPAQQCLKTLIVRGEEKSLVALLIRGDHALNAIKVEKIDGIIAPLEFATDAEIFSTCQCNTGSIGPIGLNIRLIADRSVTNLANFVCGANQANKHYTGVNWERDLPQVKEVADLRYVVEGDPSPDGKGTLTIVRGIEVGHIFQLGTTYSTVMNANIINEAGKSKPMSMGCYGIGISRIVAASVEQNNDKNGIIWPNKLAPFMVALCPINMHKSIRLRDAANILYQQLCDAGIDVLFDDRKVRAGFMLSDMELIGIPHCIIFSDRGLDSHSVEYRARIDSESQQIALDQIITFMQAKINQAY